MFIQNQREQLTPIRLLNKSISRSQTGMNCKLFESKESTDETVAMTHQRFPARPQIPFRYSAVQDLRYRQKL
jgi:hypothetical protein